MSNRVREWLKRHKRQVELVAVACVGAGLALLCPTLPHGLQAACKVAARIWQALT